LKSIGGIRKVFSTVYYAEFDEIQERRKDKNPRIHFWNLSQEDLLRIFQIWFALELANQLFMIQSKRFLYLLCLILLYSIQNTQIPSGEILFTLLLAQYPDESTPSPTGNL